MLGEEKKIQEGHTKRTPDGRTKITGRGLNPKKRNPLLGRARDKKTFFSEEILVVWN